MRGLCFTLLRFEPSPHILYYLLVTIVEVPEMRKKRIVHESLLMKGLCFILLDFGPFPHSFYYLPVVEIVVVAEMEKKKNSKSWFGHLKSFRENLAKFPH